MRVSGSAIRSLRRSIGEAMNAPAANSAAGALAYRRVTRWTRSAVASTASMDGSRADHSSTPPVTRAMPAMSQTSSVGFSAQRSPKISGSRRSPRASMSRAIAALLPSSQMNERTDRLGSEMTAHTRTIQAQAGTRRTEGVAAANESTTSSPARAGRHDPIGLPAACVVAHPRPGERPRRAVARDSQGFYRTVTARARTGAASDGRHCAFRGKAPRAC